LLLKLGCIYDAAVQVGVEFWGVRGSIACPSPEHLKCGGNTSCVLVTAGERHIILDAGTGLRPLGSELRRGVRSSVLLLSHVHGDHINGLPFFAPAFRRGCRLQVFADLPPGASGVRGILAGDSSSPLLPVSVAATRAEIDLEDFRTGDPLALGGGIRVRTAPLRQPNGATGYRLQLGEVSIAYVTDTEHTVGMRDPRILALIEGVDLVIYDSSYTDKEFPTKIGWGHSTWQEVIRLCREANARRLAIFHHDPDHDDRFMLGVEREARASWPNAFVTREGMRLQLS
jgi:phosphoribosyl 1,2-cyclic phosphodiesterase